jgi:hypothetical protein
MADGMDFSTPAPGGWRQRSGKISADEYRRLRAACLVMATQSKSPDERARWLGMAQSIDDLTPELISEAG